MTSVLVPSFNDDLLDTLFTSMERCERHSTNRVIVGDNGVSRSFWHKWPLVRSVQVTKPFVYSQAINRCAWYADSDLLIIGDDSEMMTDMWATRIDTYFDAWEPDFGMVNLTETTRISKPLGLFETEESPVSLAFSCTLIPRRIWNEIGPMDEQFVGYGYDDTDYCVRLWQDGYKVGICGAATIKHERGTVGYERALGSWNNVIERQRLNATIFRLKWGIPVNPAKSEPWEYAVGWFKERRRGA